MCQTIRAVSGAGLRGRELAAVRCPCCGRELESFLYLRGGQAVGCEGCVTAFEVWELPPGYADGGEERRWEDGGAS